MSNDFSRMKVLLVAKPWRGGLANYVLAALRDVVGAANVTYLPTRPSAPVNKWRAHYDKNFWPDHVVRTIENASYDAAIFLYPLAQFARLKHAHKHAVWLVDDAAIAPDVARAMGHIFLSDPSYAAELQQRIPAGHLAGVLPFAMLPNFHTPLQPTRTDAAEMCFIASKGGKREQWLEQILGADIPCHIYGNYGLMHPLKRRFPRYFHGSISNQAMQKIYARHALSLNIHTSLLQAGTNMRSFEAAGYGIAQLVEYSPGIEALFDLESELTCFNNLAQLQEQYARLSRDAAAREKLAVNARARVLRDHTYHHRVRSMLQRVAGSAGA